MSKGLEEESDFLQAFLAAKTQHIVRIYRRMYRDVGSGSVKPDPIAWVHRMYLEFCPGGDLADYFDKKSSSPATE